MWIIRLETVNILSGLQSGLLDCLTLSNIVIATLDISLLILIYCSSYFTIAVVILKLFASFIHCSFYSYRSFKYCTSDNCCFFSLLKAITKIKSKLIAIASKRERKASNS